jgi:hypothetical protein
MPMNDGFDPDHPLPSFLSGHADKHEQRETFEYELLRTSRILKASILAHSGDGGRYRDCYIVGNSSEGLFGRHGFAARHFGPTAQRQSSGAANSIRRSSDSTDCRRSGD